MSFLQEFKAFAMKGNVMDLAVGVIIGGAFGKIIASLVSDIIMPTIGIILGNINFSELSFTVGESAIKYGAFLQSVVDFLIIAFCIFFMIKQLNRFQKKKPEVQAAEPSSTDTLLMEIRDAVRK